MEPDSNSALFRFSPRPNSARRIPWRAWSSEAFAEAQARNKAHFALHHYRVEPMVASDG